MDGMSTMDKAPSQRVRIGRRGFLSVSAAAGGAMFGVSVAPRGAAAATPAGTLNTFIVINSDNTIKMIVPAAEMGQGVSAGLAQILAEELPLDWTKLTTEPAPYGTAYASPYGQVTGGSFSVRLWFDPMLKAGAAIREMLVAAAAARWGVTPDGLVALNTNRVRNPATSAVLTYAELAPAAALLTVPAGPKLISAGSAYKVIGTAAKRPDIPSKVNGSAVFGIDVKVPGMVFASVKHAPAYGATVASVGSPPAGTTNVVNLGNAVAVVASNTWAAIQGARNVAVTWNMPANLSQINSSAILTKARGQMTNGPVAVAEETGNVATAMTAAKKKLSLTYQVPYLPHAGMEVQNCTASVTDTTCEVWAPTQGQDWAAYAAQAACGLPLSAITVHQTLIGAGFGRRLENDYVTQAVKISKAIGKPVKLTWSREEDFGNDFYRPMALMRVNAGLDASGNIVAWDNRIVAPSVTEDHWPGSVANGLDESAVEGATGSTGLVYKMAARRVEYGLLKAPIRVGWLRSVAHSYTCFAVESAIDELAAAAGIGPLAYRRQLLADRPKHLAVLNAAATLANWTTAPPAGTARGIAMSDGFGSIVALIVEMTKVTDPVTLAVTYPVTKAFCAIDCGTAVNPNQIRAQMQGGLVMGMTTALWGRSSFDNGAATPRNFDDYRMMKMRNMPQVSVTIVNQGSPLGGVGETIVPPTAPAIANAYAKLTGTRKRTLPLGIAI